MTTANQSAPGADSSGGKNAIQLLDAAAGHMRARAATYDKPEGERSMAQTVAIFNLHHGTNLTEAQGWHFMRILKDVRLFTSPVYHSDSAEDGIAYQGLMAEAKSRERNAAKKWVDITDESVPPEGAKFPIVVLLLSGRMVEVEDPDYWGDAMSSATRNGNDPAVGYREIGA